MKKCMETRTIEIQINFDVLGPAIILVRGLAEFVLAVAYHFCLKLPETFSHTVLFSGPVNLLSKV